MNLEGSQYEIHVYIPLENKRNEPIMHDITMYIYLCHNGESNEEKGGTRLTYKAKCLYQE